jgi:hypothetical protein
MTILSEEERLIAAGSDGSAMAMRIVNVLEVIQINEQQCAVFPVTTCKRSLLPQTIQHQAPVGQPGQQVSMGITLQFDIGDAK